MRLQPIFVIRFRSADTALYGTRCKVHFACIFVHLLFVALFLPAALYIHMSIICVCAFVCGFCFYALLTFGKDKLV